MEKVKSHLKDTPTYITFDIDGIDPSDCPGTGELKIEGEGVVATPCGCEMYMCVWLI